MNAAFLAIISPICDTPFKNGICPDSLGSEGGGAAELALIGQTKCVVSNPFDWKLG